MRPYAALGAVTGDDAVPGLTPVAALMLSTPGTDIVLEVERAEAQTVNDPYATISAEALDELRDEMGLFVASRILRAIYRGRAPQRVTVRVVVKLDGKAAR